jgi:tyrosine-specific transport protein
VSSLKFTGCILLVISCMIGGGILALPIVANQFGLLATYALMIFAYIIMLISGLFTLELSSKLPVYKNNFSSIAENSFGKYSKYLIMFSFAVTLYTVLTAYISASPDIFLNTFLKNYSFNYQNEILSLIFTILLGGLVVANISYAEKLNSFVMIIKLASLVVAIIFLNLNAPSFTGFEIKSLTHISQGFSVIILVFSYQSIIPSLVNYVGKNNVKSLRWVLITATTSTLIISLLWINAIVSLVSPFGDKYQEHLTLGELIQIIDTYKLGGFTTAFLKAFFNITLIASFIALSIAFIDFLIDMLKLKYTLMNRIYCGFIAYIPCWLIANFYSDLFIKAVAISGFSGLFFALLLPSLASYKLYSKEKFQLFNGKLIRVLMSIISIVILSTIATGIF